MNKRRRWKAKGRRLDAWYRHRWQMMHQQEVMRAASALSDEIDRRGVQACYEVGELIHLKTRYAVSREFGIVLRCEGEQERENLRFHPDAFSIAIPDNAQKDPTDL